MSEELRKLIPVILDTDIGDDIDDTWALAMLLKSPEIDLRMVVTDYGNTVWRAELAAKFLQTVGRSDIPIGVGLKQNDDVGAQAPWTDGYRIEQYPGMVEHDGIDAMIRMVMDSDEQITLCCIGPCPNIGEVLRREPRLADRARFVGMYGSVFKGYEGADDVSVEWNVKADAQACRAAFTAPWEMTITPVDTCGLVVLDGDRYARLRDSDDLVVRTLLENYRVWARNRSDDAETQSSVLFDTVAAHLVYSCRFVEIERIGIRVTDEGFTVPDYDAKQVDTAVRWRDLDGYLDYLVDRLLGPMSR
jgi:inosine-uridine nucleoside N-ribohydrolase